MVMTAPRVTVSLSIDDLLTKLTTALEPTEEITANDVYNCTVNATSVTPDDMPFKFVDILGCWSRAADAQNDGSIVKHIITFSIHALAVKMLRRRGIDPCRQMLNKMRDAWMDVVGDDEPMSPTSVLISI